jgi:CheY-like chemotaxis protein
VVIQNIVKICPCLHLGDHSGSRQVKGPETCPDVVITDIRLPDRDGFELLQDIRGLGAEGSDSVSVIAMTAFGSIADPERTLAAGFQAHLAKPFRPDQLLEAIESVLRR